MLAPDLVAEAEVSRSASRVASRVNDYHSIFVPRPCNVIIDDDDEDPRGIDCITFSRMKDPFVVNERYYDRETVMMMTAGGTGSFVDPETREEIPVCSLRRSFVCRKYLEGDC